MRDHTANLTKERVESDEGKGYRDANASKIANSDSVCEGHYMEVQVCVTDSPYRGHLLKISLSRTKERCKNKSKRPDDAQPC